MYSGKPKVNAPRPLAQPVYILRGHATQIHAVHFFRNNSRLVTGDADGWVVVWSLAFKRPVVVWRAHDSAILGVAPWGNERLITYVLSHRLA